MVDLLTIISEAGAKGISLAKIWDKSKLNEDALQAELKRLRSELRIAGPFKYGRGFLFYTKGHEPGGDSVARLVESLIRDTGSRLPTSNQIEEKIRKPFKDYFKDGVRVLVGEGRVAELKGGNSTYFLHIEAARRLFPDMATSTGEGKKEAPASSFKRQVLDVYHGLKSEQGGLSAVSIGKLLNRLGCSKEALHHFLLDEAQQRNADLHASSSLELSHEDLEGALTVAGKSDPAITVTLRE